MCTAAGKMYVCVCVYIYIIIYTWVYVCVYAQIITTIMTPIKYDESSSGRGDLGRRARQTALDRYNNILIK